MVDIGSHVVKAGLGSSTAPCVSLPSLSGVFKYKPVFSTLDTSFRQDDVLVGKSLTQHRGVVKLSYPVQNGVVKDWKAGNLLLDEALRSVFSPEGGDEPAPSTGRQRCFAFVEPPFASRVQRQKIAERVFESAEFGEVYGMFVGVAPLLSLYSTGQLTGMGLDIGEGQVSTAAAVNGFSMPHVMRRENGGATGGGVTSNLEMLMRTYGSCEVKGPGEGCAPVLGSGSVAEREVVRQVKEAHCSVSATPLSPHSVPPLGDRADGLDKQLLSASQLHQHYRPRKHLLPDGVEVEVGVECVLAPEVLFTPSLVGSDSRALPDLITSTLSQADMDARPFLLGHLVVSGGTTLLNGFGTRVLNELLQRVPQDNKVRVVAPAERAYASWLGAAFLSQLSTFLSEMVVTKQAYEESGEPALHSRLFA